MSDVVLPDDLDGRSLMAQALVEADGLVSSPGAPRVRAPLGRRGAVVLASLLAVVVLLTLPEPTIRNLSSHEPLIQAHLDAWYGGDFESVMRLRAAERLRTGPPEDRVRGELAYQAMLGARTEVVGCEPLPPETVRCEVTYSNALIEAVGQAPIVLSQQFGIRDGLLVFVAGPYLEDVEVTASFREYALQSFPTEYEDSCVTEPNYQPPECAALKLSRIDDWAVWHLSRIPSSP